MRARITNFLTWGSACCALPLRPSHTRATQNRGTAPPSLGSSALRPVWQEGSTGQGPASRKYLLDLAEIMHWRESLPSHYPGNRRHRLLGLNEPLKNLRGMPISHYPQMRCIRSKASAIQPVLFSLVRRRCRGLNLLFSARETSLSFFLCGFTYSQDVVSTSDVHPIVFPYACRNG